MRCTTKAESVGWSRWQQGTQGKDWVPCLGSISVTVMQEPQGQSESMQTPSKNSAKARVKNQSNMEIKKSPREFTKIWFRNGGSNWSHLYVRGREPLADTQATNGAEGRDGTVHCPTAHGTGPQETTCVHKKGRKEDRRGGCWQGGWELEVKGSK